jgi:multicomponent Na+:H+ antiporter subunit A
VAAELIRLTPAAHAKDVVTAILADFRGFDTMGEITVIGIALLGTALLLGRVDERRRVTGSGRGDHAARPEQEGGARGVRLGEE